MPVALVVGVTGISGMSLAEVLKHPTAPGGPWQVYGAARRPKPSWFPPSLLHEYLQFDALDPQATQQTLTPISHLITHVFWVALQPRESEAANISANSSMLSNVLHALTTSPNSKLSHVTLQTGTKHYMGADLSCPSPATPPPFREETPRQPHRQSFSRRSSFTWSVHRSSMTLGASSRSRYNSFLTLATYALICRREGSPFRFPGTAYSWEHFCDASDAGVLAKQQIWAATTSTAKNQAFNCTNGDVFTWKAFWEEFAHVFDVEPAGPCGNGGVFGLVEVMKEKGGVWDDIVRENGLVETKLEEITCFDALCAVMRLGFQHVCCVNKSREFGFLVHVDTLKSLRKWVERYREMNILPKK